MEKATKILKLVAKILLIIQIVVHAAASLVLVGIPGLIVSIIALKKLASGSSIVMGVLTLVFVWDPVTAALQIVLAIFSKKLAAKAEADEFVEEVEEVIE